MMQHIGGNEILLIAESVAREKGISKESVIMALEDALKVAARRKYGYESTIAAYIDRKNGDISIFREMLVVEDGFDEEAASGDDAVDEGAPYITPIEISKARDLYKKDAVLGEVLKDPLPALDLGRVAAQSAKQVIAQKIKDVERERNFQEFKDRVGRIVHAVVDQVERDCVRVKIGTTEAVLFNADISVAERKRLKQGDRIRALVYEVSKEIRGGQIRLSRAHEEFVVELFRQEVPEIYDGIVSVKMIARDPGFRTKMAVFSPDFGIDAVGSCVGIRGARVQAVINELGGEKIDILPWSEDLGSVVMSALSPAEVSKVIIDQRRKRVEVVVPEEQLNIAIGKRGQNVRLASKLVGWDIDVLSEDAESKRRAEDFANATNHLMLALDVEEILAQLLASEGYTDVSDIASSNIESIAAIEGLDVDIAQELMARAQEYLSERSQQDLDDSPADEVVTEQKKQSKKLMIDKRIMSVTGMNKNLAIALAKSGIISLRAFADLSSDELEELLSEDLKTNMKRDMLDAMIMEARDKVYFSREKS